MLITYSYQDIDDSTPGDPDAVQDAVMKYERAGWTVYNIHTSLTLQKVRVMAKTHGAVTQAVDPNGAGNETSS